MKTTPFLRLWTCRLLLVMGAILLSSPVFARERFHIPPPPPPEKVVRDIRSFIHRIAHGVRDAGKQTWHAIREPFVDDDDDEPARSPRTTQRAKSSKAPSPDNSSFARSKEAVPYRYDDADHFDARVKPADENLPNVNAAPRKPPVTEPSTRRPFMAPEEKPQPLSSAPVQSPATEPQTEAPKATPPGVDQNLEFARPVPGKRGLVYPPGAKESQENMVDVGDFKTGQIVRDPRTGKLFRVP